MMSVLKFLGKKVPCHGSWESRTKLQLKVCKNRWSLAGSISLPSRHDFFQNHRCYSNRTKIWYLSLPPPPSPPSTKLPVSVVLTKQKMDWFTQTIGKNFFSVPSLLMTFQFSPLLKFFHAKFCEWRYNLRNCIFFPSSVLFFLASVTVLFFIAKTMSWRDYDFWNLLF